MARWLTPWSLTNNIVRITLTIDNGPDLDETPRVLDILNQQHTPACFFIVGKAASRPGAKEILNRIHAEGHILGNHTWSHKTPFGLEQRKEKVQEELESTQQLLASLATDPPLFRPFGGGGNLDTNLMSSQLVDYLLKNRYTCVLWNAVPRDWENDNWPDVAMRQLNQQDDGHMVLVLHDTIPGNSIRLSHFIKDARAKGCTFTQELPESCLPIIAGEVKSDLTPYVSDLC